MQRSSTGPGLLLVLLLSGALPAAHAQTFNLASPSSTVGTNPAAVVSGDFNGDGKADLAVANYGSNSLSILKGNGDGTFTAAASPAVGRIPIALAIGDFNGDGKLDIAVANYGSSANSVSILKGNGDGTFTAAPILAVGSGTGPDGVAVGDFDGDGKLDIAVADYKVSKVSLFKGQGNGTFAAPTTLTVGNSPNAIVAGDFNGDGKVDLATANYGDNTVSILIGNGSGGFTVNPVAPAVGANPNGLVVGDFNGDGKADIATANYGDNTASVLTGKGDGTFAAATSVAVGALPYFVTTADLNGDGKADLAVANFGDNTVSVLKGAGNGTFSVSATPTVGAGATSPASLAAADFNGDGKLDLASANYGTNNIGVLLNATTFPPAVTSFSPTNGMVGATVVITGVRFTGATSVKFNGTTATFTVNSDTQITATVPTGATTGKISVTTAGGTGTGSGDFTVIPPVATSGALISQFRYGGPGGTTDEFIELVNTTTSPLNVSGWNVTATGVAAPIAVTGIIPASGHLLLANSAGYSLSALATGDSTYTGDISFGAVITLKNASGTTVDTVSDGDPPAPPSLGDQYAYIRRLESGSPSNTGTFTTDFNLVDTAVTNGTVGATGVGPLTAARLGSPNPHSTASTVQRNDVISNNQINIAAVPTIARYASKGSGVDSKGRLSIRRTIKNNSGAAVSKLRFRIVAITAGSSTASGVADLRAISSGGVRYYDASNGNAITQGAVGMTIDAPTTPVEAPLTSASSGNGGGLNAGWTAPLPGGTLAPGASVNVEFLFGIQAEGSFRVVVDAELLP